MVSWATLFSAYESNRTLANITYGGKPLSISGQVAGTMENSSGVWYSCSTDCSHLSSGGQIIWVWSDSVNAASAPTESDSSFTATCVVDGLLDNNLELGDCRIQSIP